MAEEKEKVKKEEQPNNEELIKSLKEEFSNQLNQKLKEQEERFEKEKKELEERHIREMTALLKSGAVNPYTETEIEQEEEKDSFDTAVETITNNIIRRLN